MVVTVPSETVDRTWSPVLDGVHAAELDCLQANLAVVADRHHGAGTHVALGAAPRFAPAFPPDGPPSLDVPVDTRLDEASRLLGLSVAAREDGLDGPALRRLAAAHGPLYVVGDAHTMPWVPYFGQKHMEHSFLLTAAGDSCTVVDAYHNDTPWGSARPAVWRMAVADFDAAVPKSSAFAVTASAVPAVDVGAELVASARALDFVDRYVAAVREHGDRPAGWDALVLDVWLVARTRALHARWLAAAGVDDGGRAAESAQAWLTLAAQTYVAMRRARRGGGMPSALVDRVHELLVADRDVAVELAVRSAVVGALASVLELDPAVVAGPLRELPKFNSFRLVDVIERVESALRVELDPDDLATGDLRDVDALAGLFRRAVSGP